jgi:hypothetical protein
MTPLLLGFDVLANSTLATWVDETAVNREPFFLRPEVLWPITVDRVTCPSIFQPQYQTVGHSNLVMTRFPTDAFRMPVDQREMRAITNRAAEWPRSEINILGLWSKLPEMVRWMGDRPELKGLVRFAIAIQVSLDMPPDSDPLWQTISETGTSPREIMGRWTHLGFDVADRDQTSALSGSEYTARDMAGARSRWGSQINDLGLLDNRSSAFSFKEFSNERLPEDAPFYVYEIFRIALED